MRQESVQQGASAPSTLAQRRVVMGCDTAVTKPATFPDDKLRDDKEQRIMRRKRTGELRTSAICTPPSAHPPYKLTLDYSSPQHPSPPRCNAGCACPRTISRAPQRPVRPFPPPTTLAPKTTSPQHPAPPQCPMGARSPYHKPRTSAKRTSPCTDADPQPSTTIVPPVMVAPARK